MSAEEQKEGLVVYDREALKTALAIAIVKERKKHSAETEAWKTRAQESEAECDRLRTQALSHIGLDRDTGAQKWW